MNVTVRIPATTANLGPGFDCLAMTLDLWNEVTFSMGSGGFQIDIEGEGKGRIVSTPENLIARTFWDLTYRLGRTIPAGLRIRCNNQIPVGSGLGSSASAVLAGLVGANKFWGEPFQEHELMRIASDLEGHPDNAAAAFLGGLVIVTQNGNEIIARRKDVPDMDLIYVLPQVDLSTRAARAALPAQVSMKDAVFNLGRTALVVDALEQGDLDLLGKVMDDRLHQSYRLALIPGAQQALQAAKQAGAAAAVISGAGPGMLAFVCGDSDPVMTAMQNAFRMAGKTSRAWKLRTTNLGLSIED